MFNRRRPCHSRPQPICCPPNIMPTQVAPAQVSPTQEVIKTNVMNTIVPHFHPIHTTTVNRHVYHHQHYYPRTFSEVDQYFETSRQCGDPRNPNPGCFPIPRRYGF